MASDILVAPHAQPGASGVAKKLSDPSTLGVTLPELTGEVCAITGRTRWLPDASTETRYAAETIFTED